MYGNILNILKTVKQNTILDAFMSQYIHAGQYLNNSTFTFVSLVQYQRKLAHPLWNDFQSFDKRS